MVGEIGTLTWTRRTNGRMSHSERARYVAAALAEQAKVMPRLLAYRLGRASGPSASLDAGDLAVPDSRLAAETIAECRETQSASVMEHNFRSFTYARALGAIDRVDHDSELLLVATMYHDAGAFEPDLSDGGRCFTLRGAADAERRLATDDGDRAERAAEAITLHINPAVGVEQGPEAHLMHDGVLLDAVGLRAWDLPAATIESARADHPRLRFSQEGRRLLTAQAKAIPGCRVAAAIGAGFGLALRLGPWQD